MNRILDMKERYSCFTLALLLIFLILGCDARKEKIYSKSMIAMDTIVLLKVVSDSPDKADQAMEKTFEEIKKLEAYFDPKLADSDVSKINAKAGVTPVKVSPETVDMIIKAVYVSVRTNGAFDITIGPASRLWDFHKKIKPNESVVRQELQLVDYKNIAIDTKNQTIYLKKKGMSIDAGGIAKGYAADRAVETLKNRGIKSGLVSIAGDIKAFGLKSDLKVWKIGIQNPRQKGKSDEIIAAADLTDLAVSTAGDYQRYFMDGDKRYHHILDPKTGYPVNDCMSVSVFAADGAMTDAFSTGIFVLGYEKGQRLLESLGFDAVIVDKEGKMFITPNLRGKIKILENKKNN